MHGVRDPDDGVPGRLDGLDLPGQTLLDLPRAVASDERHLPVLPIRVDNCNPPPTHTQSAPILILALHPRIHEGRLRLTVEEADELVRLHARADLDADGVPDPAEVLDVRAVELARAVPDPQEVRRGVVVRPRPRRGTCACAGGGKRGGGGGVARRERGGDRELARHRLLEV